MSSIKGNSNSSDALLEWKQLFSALITRFKEPWAKPTYVFYFVLSMLIGAIGIWVSLANLFVTSQPPNQPSVADVGLFQSVLTFFAAVGSVSCVQVLIMEDEEKHLRSFFIFLLFVFIALALSAALVGFNDPNSAWPFLTIGTFLAVVTWWVANWEDGKFGQSDNQAALGGPSEDEPIGDSEGFSV